MNRSMEKAGFEPGSNLQLSRLEELQGLYVYHQDT